LFEAFVSGRLERAKLFADLLAECQKGGVSAFLPGRVAHSFPPASPDSTCPLLLLDQNNDEPRNFRSPFGREDDGGIAVGMSELRVSGSAQFGLRGLRDVLAKIGKLCNNPKMRVLFLDLRQEREKEKES
jgi:hypothetical protein